MANTFLTPTDVVRDAALILNDELLVANLAVRSLEQNFARKVGDTVYVKTPPVITGANTFTSTTSATNVTEVRTAVTLQKHYYVRVDLTSDELTEQLDDFNTVVVQPAVRGMVRTIEAYLLGRLAGGFARNVSGTQGTSASTQAHILAAEKVIYANRGDVSNLVSVISPTVHASLAALAQFTSADYGTDRPAGLTNNTLGKLAGIQFYRSPNVTSLTRGDISGSVTASGTAANAYCSLASLTSATGTVYEGCRFVVAGDATVYTVTADTAIASNAVASLPITPVLASSPSTAAVTFQTAVTQDVIYNPAAFAVAIVPGAIVGPNVAAATVNGVGLRIISDVSTSTLTGSWVFDCYVGGRVVMNEYGAIMQG